jgi:hypothetical protein
MCGTRIGGAAAPAAPYANIPAIQPGAIGQMVVGGLVNMVERYVQSKVQSTVGPLGQIVEQFTGGPAGPPVSSTPAPAWYEEAYREGQPKMSATEIARRQAAAQSRSRQAAKICQQALSSHHESMMSILRNING